MTDLPREVRDLALRLGADPARVAGQSIFRQDGEMKLSLNSSAWHRFSACQTIAVTSCAFDWQAQFRPFGYLSVTDALKSGKGQLDVTALGMIPLVRSAPSVALTKAEMLRYLAELPFAPDAMLHNRALSWRVIGTDELAVSCGPTAMQTEVILKLNPDGRVASATAQDRPRSTKAPYLPTRWHGVFSDYRHQYGRWVPFAAAVSWIIDGQDVPYWRGRLSNWAMPSAPLASMEKNDPRPILQGTGT